MEKLLTVAELSKLLALKPGTIYQWSREGKIPKVKLGGALRFNLAAVMAALADKAKGSA